MQYKKLKSSNLTQINGKTPIMDLTFILRPVLRDEKKNYQCKNHYRFPDFIGFDMELMHSHRIIDFKILFKTPIPGLVGWLYVLVIKSLWIQC